MTVFSLAAVGQRIVAEPLSLDPAGNVIAVHLDFHPVALDVQRHEYQFLVKSVDDVSLFIRGITQAKFLKSVIAGSQAEG